MLAVYCNQNNIDEITMNGYQVRKISKIRNLIFGLKIWETFLGVKAKVGMFTRLST